MQKNKLVHIPPCPAQVLYTGINNTHTRGAMDAYVINKSTSGLGVLLCTCTAGHFSPLFFAPMLRRPWGGRGVHFRLSCDPSSGLRNSLLSCIVCLLVTGRVSTIKATSSYDWWSSMHQSFIATINPFVLLLEGGHERPCIIYV